MFDRIFANAPPDLLVELWQPKGMRHFVKPADVEHYIAQRLTTGTDTYYGVALRNRAGSEKGDVYGTHTFWVDIDRKAAPRATFPPSAMVFSGGGWHYYWYVDEWITDHEAIEKANKILMADVEGDNCFNVNRLLRVPGTANTKYDPPVSCELRQKRGYTYRLRDFIALAKLDSQSRHKIQTGDRRGYRSRSERDWAVVRSLLLAGADDWLVEFLYANQPVGDKYTDPTVNGEQYLSHTIEQVRLKLAEEEEETPRAREGVLNTGIFEGDDGFWTTGKSGRRRLSTFILKPTLLLEGDLEDALVCDVVIPSYTWKGVTFPKSAFNDRKALDKCLTLVGWSWLGSDNDVRYLLPYLLDQWKAIGAPRTKATSVLGRHGNVFVGNEQCLDGDVYFSGTTGPLVFLGPKRERPDVLYSNGTHEVGSLLEVNLPTVIWPVLGWFMATPFKPILEAHGIRFPILNLYGTRGSGKTSLLRTMQTLVGYKEPAAYDCATTRFVKLALLGSSNAIPISFSEYRASVADQILRFVLLAYDTGHDPRGRSDQSTVDYPLCAPFTIDGEDGVGDSAAKERIIAIGMSPESIEEGTACYHAFNGLPDLTGFAGGYIQWSLKVDWTGLLAAAVKGVELAFPEVLPARVRNNIVVVALGICAFCAYTKTSLPDFKAVLVAARDAVWSKEMGRGSVLADEFAETIVNTVAMHKAAFFHSVKGKVVWFQLATAFQWWLRQRTLTRQPTLDRHAIATQLAERHVKRGTKGQYVVGPELVQGVLCWGIDLPAAVASGLEVPSDIGEIGLSEGW